MNTTDPTAWPAHPTFQLRKRLLDSYSPRLRFLAACNPADPLVARERRNIFPERQRFWRLNKGLPQILRQFVYCSGGDFYHNCILPTLPALYHAYNAGNNCHESYQLSARTVVHFTIPDQKSPECYCENGE